MNIPFIHGREFNQSDTSASSRVAIINEAAARRFWPGQNPIGRRIADSRAFFDTEFKEIVGVVKDSKYFRLYEETRPAVYAPLAQDYRANMALHIRAAGDPMEMLAAARREVQALDQSLPVYDIKTLEDQKSGSLYTSRLAAMLLTMFGLLALSLAAVGLYGMMTYAVNMRRREIGIRISLGARNWDVIRQVIAEGMTTVTIGMLLGFCGALAATRLVKSFLYGVTATDPMSFTGAALLLLAVALFANYLPARHASRTDPLIALRCDK